MVINEFGKLKEVIVGRELKVSKRALDLSFKVLYSKIMKDKEWDEFEEYKISQKFIDERNEDLDNFAKLLENMGVNVIRPEKQTDMKKIKTPYFESLDLTSSNVRDLTLVYKDAIFEFPPIYRGRYFEHHYLYNYFKKKMYKDNYLWIKAPLNRLMDDSIDYLDWDEKRNFENFNIDKYDIAIDAAQYLKINDILLCNYSLYNHKLGTKWFELNFKRLFPDTKIIYTKALIDNHLDGNIIPLREGVLLINDYNLYKPIEYYLPNEFKKWKLIKINNDRMSSDQIKKYLDYYTSIPQIASLRGMDINVLSYDRNTVFVNKDSMNVIKALEKEKFDVIPVQLRHSEIFGGGLHCVTLDVNREE